MEKGGDFKGKLNMLFISHTNTILSMQSHSTKRQHRDSFGVLCFPLPLSHTNFSPLIDITLVSLAINFHRGAIKDEIRYYNFFFYR